MIVDESWSKPRDPRTPGWFSIERRHRGRPAVAPTGWLALGMTLVAGALCQALTPSAAWLVQARAPFLLAVVLYYGLRRPLGVVLTTAILAGLLQDALSPIPLGYSSACFLAIAFALRPFVRLVDPDSLLAPACLAVPGSFVIVLGLYALLASAGLVKCPAIALVLKTMLTALLGLLVTPFVFLALRRVDGFLGITPYREDANGLG